MSDWMRDEINRHRASRLAPAPAPRAGTPDPVDPGTLRLRIAGERGVPLEACDRLRGETRAEVEADVDMLVAAGLRLGNTYDALSGPPTGGVRTSATPPQRPDGERVDEGIRREVFNLRSGGGAEVIRIAGGVQRP